MTSEEGNMAVSRSDELGAGEFERCIECHTSELSLGTLQEHLCWAKLRLDHRMGEHHFNGSALH